MTDTRAKKCPICGRPTGELITLKDGKDFIYTDEDEIAGYERFTNFPRDLYYHCIICGNRTHSGYAFCESCFDEFDKDFLLNFLNEKSLIEYIKKIRERESE